APHGQQGAGRWRLTLGETHSALSGTRSLTKTSPLQWGTHHRLPAVGTSSCTPDSGALRGTVPRTADTHRRCATGALRAGAAGGSPPAEAPPGPGGVATERPADDRPDCNSGRARTQRRPGRRRRSCEPAASWLERFAQRYSWAESTCARCRANSASTTAL